MPTRVISLYPGESFTLTLTVEGDRRPVRLEFIGWYLLEILAVGSDRSLLSKEKI